VQQPSFRGNLVPPFFVSFLATYFYLCSAALADDHGLSPTQQRWMTIMASILVMGAISTGWAKLKGRLNRYYSSFVLATGETITLPPNDGVFGVEAFTRARRAAYETDHQTLAPLLSEEKAILDGLSGEQRNGMMYIMNLRRALRAGLLRNLWFEGEIRQKSESNTRSVILSSVKDIEGDRPYRFALLKTPIEEDEFIMLGGKGRVMTNRRVYQSPLIR
jgi:hypothetical protein